MDERPILLLSDVHGCFNTLTRLLNRAPKGCRIILLGDLIDRGPDSRKVIEWAMDNAIPTTCGNHEDLCMAFYNGGHCAKHYEKGIWLYNGGDKALLNWRLNDDTNPARAGALGAFDESLGGRVPDKVLDWMAALPAYLTPDAPPDANGRRLLCSHTGYGLEADAGSEGWFGALWGRHAHGDGPFPEDDLYRVHGHTQKHKAEITDTYAMIDTGAAYAARGYGNLTAMLWPSKELIVQPFDEAPVEPNFRIQDGVLLGV